MAICTFAEIATIIPDQIKQKKEVVLIIDEADKNVDENPFTFELKGDKGLVAEIPTAVLD